jgi:hypothetical protein
MSKYLEVANTPIVGDRRKRSIQANSVTWLGLLTSFPIAVDGRSIQVDARQEPN